MEKTEKKVFHPSGLGYLQVCPLFKNDETRDDSAAVRGTKLHEMVATGKGDMELLTPEDQDAVTSCREYLKSLKNKANEEVKILQEITMWAELADRARLTGTVDVLVFESSGRYAKVIDWKFGAGAVPEARSNPQTMSYAFMVFTNYPLVQQVTTVLVCPLQEDALVDSHVWDRADLPSIRMVLENVTERVMAPDAKPVLNWSVCRYCGAKATCSEMSQVMRRTSDLTTANDVLELLSVKTLAPVTRGKWHQIAEWAEDWAKQVKRANLEAVLENGEEVSGYAVQRRRGSIKVENTAVAVKLLVTSGYNEELVLSACSLSIPQLTSGMENQPEGGAKDEIREKIEYIIRHTLREGEPVVYLKRKPKSKKKEIV